jgi:hypothetical protein
MTDSTAHCLLPIVGYQSLWLLCSCFVHYLNVLEEGDNANIINAIGRNAKPLGTNSGESNICLKNTTNLRFIINYIGF